MIPGKRIPAALILSIIALATLASIPGGVRADSWSDDFSSYPNFDPRWSPGGIGVVYPDGEGYAWPKSFDPLPENEVYPIADEDLPLWYGPTIRADIPLSGDFAVTGTFNCIADVADFNVGKLEVRLLDGFGSVVHAMGWADTSNSSNAVTLYARGQGGSVIYQTDEGYTFSIFIGKSITIARTSGNFSFQLEGSEVFSAPASQAGVRRVEVAFMRHKAGAIELMCTPNTMKLDAISVQYEPAAVPGAPQSLACQAGDSHASLSWQPPADTGGLRISNYRVYRGTSSDALQFLTSVGAELAYDDAGLVNGQAYYYAVSAVNEAGEGSLSGSASCTPVAVPGAPLNVQALAGQDHVNITWSDPVSDGGSAITGFTVLRGLAPDQLSDIASLGPVNAYTDTDVVSQTTYYYAVSAASAVGEGAASAAVQATPGGVLAPPSEPRELAAGISDGAVALSWLAPASNGNARITNYTIYRGFNLQTMSLHATVGDTLHYEDQGLTNGQRYYYAVSATNTVGEGGLSPAIEAVPMAPAVPSPPFNVTLEADYGQINLSWEPPLDDGNSPVTGYSIYRGTGPSNLTLLATLGNVRSYVDTGLAEGAGYYYSLTATNAVGEGLRSETASATTLAHEIIDPTDGGDSPDGSTGTWSLSSSIVTVAVLVVSMIIAMLYFRKRGGPEA